MAKKIKIKRGLNIPIEGYIPTGKHEKCTAALCAIYPEDYPGYTWKCMVKVGDEVKSGSPLMTAKENPMIALTSPLTGTVDEIVRGERRKIIYVSVKGLSKNDALSVMPENIIEKLYISGLFAMMRQRPFDIVPDFKASPRDIFVTAFDTAPLAANILDTPLINYLEDGLKALSTLTSGKVYLGVCENSSITSQIAEVVEFNNLHPAGNVGTQIAAIKPVNKGETVWSLDAVTACRIGKLVEKGILDYSTVVALTGSEMKTPKLVDTTIGVKLSELLKNQIDKSGIVNSEIQENKSGNTRFISGNVLTGKKVDMDKDFLRFPYRQITAIEEGEKADEFMGWASLNPKRFSVSRAFPSFLRGKKQFHFDARIKGGERAMIMSGEYDKVFPMDIYPEYLIKAILSKNIERMEALGIYEVAPEDFALAEFADSSKMELQKIVREGLDYLRRETT